MADFPLFLLDASLELGEVVFNELDLIARLVADSVLKFSELLLQLLFLGGWLEGRVLGLLMVLKSLLDDCFEVAEQNLGLVVVQLGGAVLLDELLAVGVVHLAEQLFAELLIALDGLALVYFSDYLFLLVHVLLDLATVFLEGGVARDHVEPFEPAYITSYFLSMLRRILLRRL